VWQYRGDLAATCCRVILSMALPRRLGHDAMSVLSHAGDGAVEPTWPWHDVGAKSYW
jgi:hypothetical protein